MHAINMPNRVNAPRWRLNPLHIALYGKVAITDDCHMNLSRRQLCLFSLSAGLLHTPTWADTSVDEGIDFEVLPKVQPTRSGGRIEVIEFFRYGCPFCDRLEPVLKRWARAHEKAFALRKVPVSFQSTTHQQLHLTLVQLKQEERLAPLIYDAIHRHARALDSLDDIVDWVSHHGMDARAFTQTWHSPAVGQAIAHANAEVQAYGVKFVPQFGVNGRYLTSPSMVGGDNARALEVVEALVKRELAERKG